MTENRPILTKLSTSTLVEVTTDLLSLLDTAIVALDEISGLNASSSSIALAPRIAASALKKIRREQ